MKYKLYVSGFCSETRNFESSMGIGGVILNDEGDEKVFSKYLGKGTITEAHIHGILYGIDKVIKDNSLSELTIYSTNMMIINLLNRKNVEIPNRIEELTKELIKKVHKLEFKVNYEYFEVNEYKYVRNLAEEAMKS